MKLNQYDQSSTTNFRRIATPFQGLSRGNRHAAPIMSCMVGAASRLSVYPCVAHTEAFLMAGSTSYLKRL
jgi:hypothetical protein